MPRLRLPVRAAYDCLYAFTLLFVLFFIPPVGASDAAASATFKLTVMGEHAELCRDVMTAVRHSRIATASDGDLRDALVDVRGNIFTSDRMRDLAWKPMEVSSKESLADEMFTLAHPPRDTKLYADARDAFHADLETLLTSNALEVSKVELNLGGRSMELVEINRRKGNKDPLLGLYFPLSELIVDRGPDSVPQKVPVRGKVFTFDGTLMVFSDRLGKWVRERSSGEEFTLLSFDFVDIGEKPFVDYACEIRVNRPPLY